MSSNLLSQHRMDAVATYHAQTRNGSPFHAPRVSRAALLAGLTVLAYPLAGHAQSANDQNAGGTVVLAPISVDAKADVITGGVQMDEDDFERINPQTLQDLFSQEPGVSVSSPLPAAQKIFVNGIEDTNLAVDIDGARQANKTYHHSGTTVLDPGLFKAVKIESGVAPADAGPAALAGSISLETKDGRDLVKEGNVFGGFTKLSYNSNVREFGGDVALAANAQGFDILLYGTRSEGDAYHDGDGNTVEGTQAASRNVIGKLAYTAGNGYRFKLGFTRFDDNALRDGRLNFGSPAANVGEAYNDYSRQSLSFSFGDETPTDTLDPVVTFSVTKAHLDADQYASNRNIIARINSMNGKAQNTFATDYGAITVGGDYFRDEGSGGLTSTGETMNREIVTNYGAYVQARTDWTDDLRTSVGGRYDFNELVGVDDSTNKTNGASGNINAEYDLNDRIMGYGGVGTVFGGLPMTEVGVLRENATYTYDGMEGERSFNGKLGARVTFGDVTVDGHVFKTYIRNRHELSNSASTSRDVSYSVKTDGLNLAARYDYGSGYVRAGYTHADVEVNGQTPTSAASDYYTGRLLGDIITLEAHHTLSDYNTRIGMTSEIALSDSATYEYVGEDLNGYFVANIYGEWKPDELPGLTLRADIRNLFDRTYADRFNAGGYSTNSVVVATNNPGRTFLVSAKYEF